MKITNYKLPITKKAGFTLVEIMVATTIFMLVMLMALGALVVTSNAAKKAQTLRSAMDNVNFAMDSMARSLRTGTHFYCIRPGSTFPLSFTPPASGNAFPFLDCKFPQYGTAIAFVPQDHAGQDTAYIFDNTNHVIKKCDASPSCVDMTAPNVIIEEVKFFVVGSALPPITGGVNGSDSDLIQPSVYIIMKGKVVIGNIETTFALQTLASARTLE